MLPTPDFISNFVERQFPAFYREEGETFISFVKAYYEWLEQTGYTNNKTRNLYSTRDIDETANQFVENFKQKYLFGIPKEIAGDKRFLQKHILDVYRSKGSIEGLKLLFRLLYNEEIEVYIPSYDILKPSDGQWVERRYLEITFKESNNNFNGKIVTGVISKATAFVESYERHFVNNRILDLFYISNINGTFQVDEKVVYEGLSPLAAPSILGSPQSIVITSTKPGNDVGDFLIPTSGNGTGTGLKTLVTTTREAGASNATIEFTIIDGGTGYTANPSITISTGSNTSGSNATFTGVTLKDTSTFTYNTNLILPVVATLLSAANYGATLNNANLATILDNAFSYNTTTIGTIASLTGINPGIGYNGYVNVTIRDNLIAGYNIPDANGNIIGQNANVSGNVVIGTGLVSSVNIKNSGLGYHTKLENIEVYNQTKSNNSLTTTAKINLGAVGIQEGFWASTKGILDSNKYIQDSYYYQEYSYEINSSKSLDKYLKVLRDVFHPVGNEVFGRAFIFTDNDSQKSQVLNDVTVYRIIGAALAPVNPGQDQFQLNVSRLV